MLSANRLGHQLSMWEKVGPQVGADSVPYEDGAAFSVTSIFIHTPNQANIKVLNRVNTKVSNLANAKVFDRASVKVFNRAG